MQATRSILLVGSLALAAVRGASAQAPAYGGGMLECARFSESVAGSVESRLGPERRLETLGRAGILVVRAAPDSGGLLLEAWYDTLAVLRDGPEGRFTADTDGIIGGRYRGVLEPRGDFLSLTTPYVPAALRDLFDFSRILLRFFPPLPPIALEPGGEWTDGAELTIWRLADSAAAGTARRYRWVRREQWQEGVAVGDSTLVVSRTEREEGRLLWSAAEGPLGWSSAITAGLAFPGGGAESEVKQQVEVRRIPGGCPGR